MATVRTAVPYVFVQDDDGGRVYTADRYARAAVDGTLPSSFTPHAIPWAAVAEARAWTEDVVGNPDDVQDATDVVVLMWVHVHYDGGLLAFLEDGGELYV